MPMTNSVPTQTSLKDALAQYEHVGAYLGALRKHYRLSVEDVAKRLHIRSKYIRAMEEGHIEELPGRVYTIGYLQSYGEFLGLDGKELIEHYQLEKPLPATAQFKLAQLNETHGKPASQMLIVMGVLLMLVVIGWQIFIKPDVATPPAATIEAVPSEMLINGGQKVTTNRRNRECLDVESTAAFPPCYHDEKPAANIPFILNPVRNQLELAPLFNQAGDQ